MASSFRGRNFAFILYPDSCVYGYVDMIKYLSKLGVSMAVSPLHIPDGEVKKPHYHCLMSFDGVKSIESLENLTNMDTGELFDFVKIVNFYKIGKQTIPHFIIVNSVCGYYRYLIHKDNSDKQQFEDVKIFVGYEGLQDSDKKNSIVHLNGFNSRDYLDRDKKISEDMQLVNIMIENNIGSLRGLIMFLALNNYNHLLDYIHKNLYFVKNFLFSTEGKDITRKVEEIKKLKKEKLQEVVSDIFYEG